MVQLRWEKKHSTRKYKYKVIQKRKKYKQEANDIFKPIIIL